MKESRGRGAIEKLWMRDVMIESVSEGPTYFKDRNELL